MAFVASFLSIIASLLIYRAQKEQSGQVVITKYYIAFQNDQEMISKEDECKILQKKGLKGQLAKSICSELNISDKSIEVGYATLTARGCIIQCQHAVFKNDLEMKQRQSFQAQYTNQGYIRQITPQFHVQKLYKRHNDEISAIFRSHFDLNDAHFKATYYATYQGAINAEKQQSKPYPTTATKIYGAEAEEENGIEMVPTTANDSNDIICKTNNYCKIDRIMRIPPLSGNNCYQILTTMEMERKSISIIMIYLAKCIHFDEILSKQSRMESTLHL